MYTETLLEQSLSNYNGNVAGVYGGGDPVNDKYVRIQVHLW